MKIAAHTIRSSSAAELISQLKDHKEELAQLRVAKATGGAASKLAKIKVVRHNIARILTVYNQKQKNEARDKFKGAKFVPKDIRPKLSRSLRKRMTKEQKQAVTKRQNIKNKNFPMRKFALKA